MRTEPLARGHHGRSGTVRRGPNDRAPSVGVVSESVPTLSGVSLPLREIATCPRPAEQYAALRAHGVHRRPDGWVVARPEDVASALTSSALNVAPPGRPAGDAGRLRARMARFSDGPDHARRRALTEALLPDVDAVRQAAAERTEALLRDRTVPFDLMPLARTVPVAALATALGVSPADSDRLVTLIGRLCDALSPSLTPPDPEPDADLVARELVALLEPVGPWDAEQVAAVVGVLFQARDATAALIGAALLASTSDGDGGRRLGWSSGRHDRTRRCSAPGGTPSTTSTLGGVTVPRGAEVWVMLAAAERGPTSPPATFGGGPHACPGSALALAIAGEVIAVTLASGLRPVPGQPVTYEPRPNLRVPARLMVGRS